MDFFSGHALTIPWVRLLYGKQQKGVSPNISIYDIPQYWLKINIHKVSVDDDPTAAAVARIWTSGHAVSVHACLRI